MKVLQGALLLTIGMATMVSCVSKKKFTEAVTTAEALGKELQLTKGQVLTMETVNSNITQSVTALQEDKLRLENEKQKLEEQIRRLSNEQVDQKQQFESALQEKVKALEQKEQKLNAIEALLQKRDEQLATLQEDLKYVLKPYSAEEISVDIKDGKLIMTATDALVFDEGTTQVTRRGREAAGLTAAVLAKYLDVDIAVVCHTDNAPPSKKSTFRNNWEFSAARAAAVSRVLTNDFFLNANQVSAVGRAEFQPKSSNETKEGRAQNRRLEIIVSPKMADWNSLLGRG